ncbi:reverse transcriptase domain-containing protein [Tanacetum coccineum]
MKPSYILTHYSNACRCTAATRDGRIGGQASRGGGRNREQTGRVLDKNRRSSNARPGLPYNLRPSSMITLNKGTSLRQIRQSPLGAEETMASMKIIQEIANVGNSRNGCSYKDFVACKLKEFDGKGGAVAYIRWVEKMEAISGCRDNQKRSGSRSWHDLEDFKALMKEEYCPSNEMQKLETEFWNYVMVRVGHAAYTDRFHELARLVPHLVTPETKRIESDILKTGVLTDEAVKNGSLKRNGEKRGDSSKEGNVRGDNKKARNGKVFATITNPVRKGYTGSAPKCTNCNFHHRPETPCRACTNYNRLRHFAKDCRAEPRMVNPLNTRNLKVTHGACYKCGGTNHYKAACPRLNRAPGQGENRPNQALAIEGGQGRENNGNPACGRAFVMGAEEARQDPNIVMGTFSLNNHYATMLFDSGADYSFVSTTFMPLLDIKPNSLGLSYEIEIASG